LLLSGDITIMKKNFLKLLLVATLAGAACKGTPAPQEQDTGTRTGQAATDASQQLAYICPMACEGSASKAPGHCPACGMDLQQNPDHQPAKADSAAQVSQ
jgi:hypothetical protein